MKSVTTSTSGPHSDQKWRNNAACCDSYKFGQPICSTKTADARLWRNAIGDRSWTISRGVESICTLCWKMHAAVCAWAISVRRWETNHQQPRWRVVEWHRRAREIQSHKKTRVTVIIVSGCEKRARLSFFHRGAAANRLDKWPRAEHDQQTHTKLDRRRAVAAGADTLLCFFSPTGEAPQMQHVFPKPHAIQSLVCMCGSE